jgi:CubicO group peptidase (beta-lactamase class C family)
MATIAVVALATPVLAAAAWPAANRLDAYFDALQANSLANGSIAISERGKVVYRRSVGSAVFDAAGNTPSDAGTRYRIGSVSKLFTAVFSMQLAEQARLTLDNKVAEFFPDLPNALEITYRNLLQHRSGLSNYTEAPGFEEWRTRPASREQLLHIITEGGIRFPPGTRTEYNNSNYLVMSYALEKIYERPYEDIVLTQVVKPLGLPRTYYGEAIRPQDHEAVSYTLTPGGWSAQQETDPSVHRGAGGIVSNPEDLVRFIDALFAGKLVSAYSLSSMRNQEGGSGIGLWPYVVAGQAGLGHGGRIEGFRACVYYFPERGIAIAYATNASILSMDEIVDEVLTTIFDRRHRPPTFATVKLATHQQADYLGIWNSAPGMPDQTPFRQFKAPDQPIVLKISAGADAPVAVIQDHEFKLTAFGDDEFYIREIGYFLRFYPRAHELVVRGPEWDYYLKRAK